MGVDADTKEPFYGNFSPIEFFEQYDMWKKIHSNPAESLFENSIGQRILLDGTKPSITFQYDDSNKMVFVKWPETNAEFKKMCKTADITLEYEKDGREAKIGDQRNT